MRARGDEPTPWVATEFTDGGTLVDYLDAEFDASLWFADRLVRTVSKAHALGVVHGGLCPTTVRFTTTFDSTWPVPNVGDWGLASVTKAVRRPPVRPVYAAPEHVDPDSFGGIDHSTDVYGLGTLLYSLLTGYAPFDGEPHVVVRQVASTAPAAPTDRNPTLPDAVDDLLAAFERFVDALDSVRWVE